MPRSPVIVLAGGTGGARLARGLADHCPDDLVVIGNTGDDIVIHGAYVSPDPDLITFWLADIIDARGWGIAGDSFTLMDHLRALGEQVWFKLGDRDLAIGLRRSRQLKDGMRLTETIVELGRKLGSRGLVLPMSDDPVRTVIATAGQTLALQRFLIAARGQGKIDDVAFTGAADARPTAEVLAMIAAARAIIIGPSNPILSIGPMLALPAIRAALAATAAPIVAVSPIVAGRVLKGPTAACLNWAGHPSDISGIINYYGSLLDGVVTDRAASDPPIQQLVIDTLLTTQSQRDSVAAAVLAFAAELAA